MEKEQKKVDLISEEVAEQLSKWHDADPEKRAVIVIAIEDEGACNSLEHLTKKLEAMMNSREETSDKEGKQ